MRKKFDRSLLPESPNFEHELILYERGFHSIAGIDEAGRGPWAGPVTAGAVLLPLDENCVQALAGVRDSKQLSAKKRERLYEVIQEVAIDWQVAHVMPAEIDQMGILPATKKAMRMAVEKLSLKVDALVIDAVKFPKWKIEQVSLIKGDQRSLSIAAASIMAKVSRDRLMQDMENQYSGYGFGQHKGYGTKKHREALSVLGPCDIHRKSYKPIQALQSPCEDRPDVD